jgi:hypothetical protein
LLDRFAYTTEAGLIEALKFGNNRASKFPDKLSEQFAEQWKVVAHEANTSTGFSGTLFQNRQTGELVMSLRSTEFIDDAVRDNEATNKFEIATHGWAFGQLDDMRKRADPQAIAA